MKKDLLNDTKYSAFNWSRITSYIQSDNQPMSSYNDQRLAIKIFVKKNNYYTSVLNHVTLTKCVEINGFPGSGKLVQCNNL